jgi:hypothetical protein
MDTSRADYYLLWKGRQSGPLSLAVIREKLTAGEINRMHQVGVDGRWVILGEFLDQQDGGPAGVRRRAAEAKRQAEVALREEQMRREHESQPPVQREHPAVVLAPPVGAERTSPLSHLLPKEVSVDVIPLSIEPLAIVPGDTSSVAPLPPGQVAPSYPDPFSQGAPRTCGLAIASLVLAICSLIPYVDLITWIFAIILGHIALVQIKRDPSLTGRGLAIAGLAITYSFLVLGVIAGVIYAFFIGHLIHL